MRIDGVSINGGKTKDFTAISTDGKWKKCTLAVAEYAKKNVGKDFEITQQTADLVEKIKIGESSGSSPAPSSNKVQTNIIRQNALGHATKLYCDSMKVAGNPVNVDKGIEIVLMLAEKFEAWVLRPEEEYVQ